MLGIYPTKTKEGGGREEAWQAEVADKYLRNKKAFLSKQIHKYFLFNDYIDT